MTAEVTFLGVAHPWLCDSMGHMNVRHYAAMFDDASFHLLGRIATAAGDRERGLGWADVRCEIDYRHETPSGALVTIRSGVARIGTKSLTYVHTMEDSDDGTVRAVARVTTVRFDLRQRVAVALGEEELGRARLLEIAD